MDLKSSTVPTDGRLCSGRHLDPETSAQKLAARVAVTSNKKRATSGAAGQQRR